MDWQTHLQRLERAGLDLMPGHDDACDLIEVWVDLDSWQAAGHWLTILARRFSGDQFVVWRYPGLQGEPPVVFLGDGSPELVADSVSDFFRLLATGRTWGFGWHHTHLEPREERAIAALAKAVAKSVGALQGTPEEAHQRAVARHPTFAVEMAKHPPCDEPIEMERSVYRPWWYSDTPPELAGCQVPHEAGDRALALELAEPKLTEHTAPEVISAVGSIANELGDREAALRVYRLVPGFDADVWRALAELGRSDEAAAEIAAKMSSPDTRAFDADRLVDTLQRYAGEAFDALMLQVDRQAAPWKGLVPPLDSGAPARRRRAVAAEAAERVTKWPLGSVAVRLMEAEAALDDHDPDGAREIL